MLASAVALSTMMSASAQDDMRPVVDELRDIARDLRDIRRDIRLDVREALRPRPAASFGLAGGEVHGQVVMAGKSEVGEPFVTIPDVEVFVENVMSGDTSDPVETDLGGTYAIPRQPAGIYRVCWSKDGWIDECRESTFTLKNVTKFPGTIRIRPDRRRSAGTRAPDRTGVLSGRVRLADGGSCWFDQEFFEREESARVELVELATGTVVREVRANDHGEFVLTGAPVSQPFQTRIRCGREVLRTAIFPQMVDLSGSTPKQFTLPNTTPYVKSMVARVGGDVVERASVGETVEVSAETVDADGDALRFDWRIGSGSGTLSGGGDTITWKLPGTSGRHDLYLVVDDGRGGRHLKRLTFDVGVDTTLFAGTVLGSDGPPIARAVVTVDGNVTETDGEGRFGLRVPAADIHVLHVEAEGYVELGRRLQAASPGGTWVLTRAFAQVIDPGARNEIVDSREEWIRPERRDDEKKRDRRPSRLVIEADTLVGVDGAEVEPGNGPFTAYFATIDSNTEVLPGDYGAIRRDGSKVFMTSYGSAFVDVRDASGRKYTLKPGAKAELDGAIQFPQLANAAGPPGDIPLFTFDPKSGDWFEEEEPATLSGAGDRYTAALRGFSTKNFDQAKPAPACLRVNADADVLALGDVFARVDVATGTDSVERRELELEDFDNAFYNMPPGAPFTIEVFVGAAPNDMLIHAEAGNSGGPWGGTGVPPSPYTDCGAEVVLTFPTMPPAFLQYGKGTGTLAQTQGYYAAIGASADKPTLGQWWQENGFGASDGSGGVRSSFLNHNDLGFGRDMHCRTAAAIGGIGDPVSGDVDVACYVTNYGEPNQEIGNAALAEAADQDSAIATVAMEYAAIAGADPDDRIVTFYVYAGGNDTAPLVEAADLDKAGPKFVPNLCLVCHGGNYSPGDPANPTFAELNTGASFREFDTGSFRYAGADPTDSSAQDADFRTQNEMVYHTRPAPAIGELIEAFYTGGGTAVDLDAVPDGWAVPGAGLAPQEELYLNTVGQSCRTCHVAQPGFDPLAAPEPVGTYPDWGTYEQFRDNRALSYALVCGTKAMPNALVTFKNFWLSLGPHRPEFLGTFSDPGTGWTTPLGACDP